MFLRQRNFKHNKPKNEILLRQRGAILLAWKFPIQPLDDFNNGRPLLSLTAHIIISPHKSLYVQAKSKLWGAFFPLLTARMTTCITVQTVPWMRYKKPVGNSRNYVNTVKQLTELAITWSGWCVRFSGFFRRHLHAWIYKGEFTPYKITRVDFRHNYPLSFFRSII